MNLKNLIKTIKHWIETTCYKLMTINDTPQKKAIGLGLGVCLGNFPGVGPLTAWVSAYFLKVNQAAALIGSFLTNTWLSFATLIISVKLGSFLRGKDWPQVKSSWEQLIQDFHWHKLIQSTMMDTLYSIFLGYFVVSFVLGVLIYLLALIFFYYRPPKAMKGERL